MNRKHKQITTATYIQSELLVEECEISRAGAIDDLQLEDKPLKDILKKEEQKKEN